MIRSRRWSLGSVRKAAGLCLAIGDYLNFTDKCNLT